MKFLLLLITLLCSIQIEAQSKRDYTWLFGGLDIPNSSSAMGNKYSFTENGLVLTQQVMGGEIFRQIAIICDEDTGKILFYTNGCAVFNSDHQLMENGNHINDTTPQWDYYCPQESFGGYGGKGNTMILNDPGNEQGYYIIHKPTTRVEDPLDILTYSIYYSYVDMALNDGLGAVTEKNVLAYDDEVLSYGVLNACKHSNGIDWWILQPIDDSNRFLKFLLDDTGFHLTSEQSIGSLHMVDVGQAIYSRDGSLFIIHSAENNVMIFDFDRETGYLSNQRAVFIDDDVLAGRGVAISPNNRFLYATSTYELYQIDLWEDHLEDGVVLIDTYRFEPGIFPTGFARMLAGPDCKIYILGASGTQYQHVIHNPDLKGEACNFEVHGVKVPGYLPASFSYVFPHWRMDEDEPCDPTLVGLSDIYGVESKSFHIYPNPVTTVAILSCIESKRLISYQILQSNGKVVLSGDIKDIETKIDLRSLSNGMYIVKVYDEKGQWEVKKILKM